MEDAKIFCLKKVLDKKTMISFIVSFGIIYLLLKEIDFKEVLTIGSNLDLPLYLLAIGIHYSSFYVRGLRWEKLLRDIKVKVSPTQATEMVFLSWFVNSIVPAKLGDIYRSHLLKKETRQSISSSIGTIMLERVFDIALLLCLLSISGYLLFKDKMPQELSTSLGIGYLLLGTAVTGLFLLGVMKTRFLKIVPARFHSYLDNFHKGVFKSFSNKHTIIYLIVTTAIIWFIESSRFFFVTKAMGLDLGIPVIIFVVLASSMLTAIPLTPAGLGAVEVSIVFILGIMGVDSNTGTAVALFDRLISYWSVLLIGTIAYTLSSKT
jgi:hypothetical protein